MKTAFRWLIQFYRLFISPMLGPRCRFFPSCSVYALEALEQHSLGFALWLIIKRLGRCHPWGGSGYDPVPDAPKQRSKKDSTMKKIIQMTVSKHLRCSCCPADHNFSDDSLSQSKQNSHMTHKFTPYTNPPHDHRVYF